MGFRVLGVFLLERMFFYVLSLEKRYFFIWYRREIGFSGGWWRGRGRDFYIVFREVLGVFSGFLGRLLGEEMEKLRELVN